MTKTSFMERSTSSDGYISVMNTGIKKSVDSMKAMAKQLIPYTFPKVSFEEEQQILCLKQSVIRVDGYESIVCYSQADYEQHMLETLQIQSHSVPFIPFNIVCKIGLLFMGPKHLSYIDFFRHNKKVYCWAVKSSEGKRLHPGKKSRLINYEGFDFHLLHPGSVDLF
jgi:hypothetical protein